MELTVARCPDRMAEVSRGHNACRNCPPSNLKSDESAALEGIKYEFYEIIRIAGSGKRGGSLLDS